MKRYGYVTLPYVQNMFAIETLSAAVFNYYHDLAARILTKGKRVHRSLKLLYSLKRLCALIFVFDFRKNDQRYLRVLKLTFIR